MNNTPVRIYLLVGLLVSCAIPDVDLTGKACPCGEGYGCDPATDTCVVEGEEVDAGARDLGFDAGSSDAAVDMPDLAMVDDAAMDGSMDLASDMGSDGPPTDMPPVTRTVIDFLDEWEYHDQDVVPPADWNTTTGGWPTGHAQLGYGDGDEATLLLDAEPNVPTCYFRRAVDLPTEPVDALATVVYDDGYVLFVNGTEVARANIGDTAHEAFAVMQGDGIDNKVATATIPLELLVVGTNVIAALVKQDDGASSDLSFALELEVTAP